MKLSATFLARAGALTIILAMQGCTLEGAGMSTFGDTTSGLQVPPPTELYPDDELLPVAKTHFKEGNYGYAAHYYQKAVEVTPDDAEAWLGLAASYDRARRFDRADQAYRRAGQLIGDRPEFYNNVGYSFLLRGDLVKARRNFLKAYELAPGDPTIANNLELLHDSISAPKRSRGYARAG